MREIRNKDPGTERQTQHNNFRLSQLRQRVSRRLSLETGLACCILPGGQRLNLYPNHFMNGEIVESFKRSIKYQYGYIPTVLLNLYWQDWLGRQCKGLCWRAGLDAPVSAIRTRCDCARGRVESIGSVGLTPPAAPDDQLGAIRDPCLISRISHL